MMPDEVKTPKVEAAKEAPKAETPKAETPKVQVKAATPVTKPKEAASGLSAQTLAEMERGRAALKR